MTLRSPALGRPLNIFTHTRACQNLENRQGQAENLLERLGRSPGCFGYVPGWLALLRCRLAGTDRLPRGLARFLCTAGLLGSSNLNDVSVRHPSWLLRLGCPAGWFGSTILLVGSGRLPG